MPKISTIPRKPVLASAAGTAALKQSGLRTLALESRCLQALAEQLQDRLAEPFAKAVRLIGAARGRVIVTGLGKSGHIGAKIAATFASTGTPAFFIHAAEANHGDLGMIGNDDVILALSWSGETSELSGIIAHARRFGIPLIALTAGDLSALGRQADIVLLLPKAPEACPHGLAPTTSTVMQLAMGDALAVALLEARQFSAGDFKIYHPGGSLGASLRPLGDIMHKGEALPLVELGTSMPAAMQVLAAKHMGCVMVVNKQGKLAGIVTDGDLARNISRDLSRLKVDDIMTRSPRTAAPGLIAAEAIGFINKHKITALPVTEDDRPVGIVTFHDLLRIGTA